MIWVSWHRADISRNVYLLQHRGFILSWNSCAGRLSSLTPLCRGAITSGSIWISSKACAREDFFSSSKIFFPPRFYAILCTSPGYSCSRGVTLFALISGFGLSLGIIELFSQLLGLAVRQIFHSGNLRSLIGLGSFPECTLLFLLKFHLFFGVLSSSLYLWCWKLWPKIKELWYFKDSYLILGDVIWDEKCTLKTFPHGAYQ